MNLQSLNLDQIKDSPLALVILIIAVIVLIFIAVKFGKFLLKLMVGLIVLALLGAVLWWYFHNQ